MDIIEDGKGSGYKAEVNSANQLAVKSESIPSEGFQATNGNSFIIHGECQTAATASGGLMTITNNDTANDMTITRIYVDPHTITPTDLIITQTFDAVISNGTDISSTAIVQKNRGLANTFDLSVVVSDASSDMTFTSGTQYHAFPIKTMTGQQRNMNETNVIPAGKSITFGYKTISGGLATDGEVVSFSVNIVKRTRL